MFAGYRLSAVSVLILLTCCALPTAKALTLNYTNICLLINNNEYIASGDSCAVYYTCQNGVAIQGTCPDGFYFSKDSQNCQPASSVNCFGSETQPCSGASVGSWSPVSGSCQGYYYCSANGPLRGDCPLGENFNPSAQACQYASQYPCGIISNPGTGDNMGSGESTEANGVNLCSFMPNGIFFGSASSCADWNLCTNNAMTTGVCPSGYMFNPQIRQCDYASNVPCTQVTNDPNLSNSPTVGGPCTTQGTQKSAVQCNAYYICNGINYQLYYCQNGLYYDTKSGTCTSRMNARNNCDRCLGTTASFVNMYSPTSCTGYLYCQNGIEQSSGYCATGSFFNEQAGACVIGQDPPFGCCNPTAVYGSTSTTASSAGTGSTGGSTTTDAPEGSSTTETTHTTP